jgi:hypothetical protein
MHYQTLYNRISFQFLCQAVLCSQCALLLLLPLVFALTIKGTTLTRVLWDVAEKSDESKVNSFPFLFFVFAKVGLRRVLLARQQIIIFYPLFDTPYRNCLNDGVFL